MPLSTDALEAKFAQKASVASTKVLDMNVSTAAMVGELNAMLAMRSELMGHYGTPKDPKYKPNSIKAPGAPAAAVTTIAKPVTSIAKPKPPTPSAEAFAEGTKDDLNYKNVLVQALSRKYEGILLKDKLTYACAGAGKEWTCTLSGPEVLDGEYTPDSPAPSKRLAETAAAALAVQAEFPELYKGPPSMVLREPRAPKPAGERVESDCPKNRVNTLMQAILGRSCKKNEDILYSVSEEGEEENKTYSSVLTFPSQDASQQFSSGSFATSKEADMEAARLALVWLEPIGAPVLEEQRQNRGGNEKQKSKKPRTDGGSGGSGYWQPDWNQMMQMMMMMKGKGKGKGKGW